MGFLHSVIIDQHFLQRGRLGRLLAAVAEHPEKLGIGIAEDTAVVVRCDGFRVVGRGTVTVVDASGLSYNNYRDIAGGSALSLFGLAVHSPGSACHYDLKERVPSCEEAKGGGDCQGK